MGGKGGVPRIKAEGLRAGKWMAGQGRTGQGRSGMWPSESRWLEAEVSSAGRLRAEGVRGAWAKVEDRKRWDGGEGKGEAGRSLTGFPVGAGEGRTNRQTEQTQDRRTGTGLWPTGARRGGGEKKVGGAGDERVKEALQTRANTSRPERIRRPPVRELSLLACWHWDGLLRVVVQRAEVMSGRWIPR
jgi:hypothetical protein